MLHISKQFDYAVQLIVALSKYDKGDLMSLRTFSEESGISFLFLQRIARALKAAKIIESNRGMKGGYFLTRDPSKISLMEVYEAVEGSYGMTKCLKKNGSCVRQRTCVGRPVFSKVNEALSLVLSKTYITV